MTAACKTRDERGPSRACAARPPGAQNERGPSRAWAVRPPLRRGRRGGTACRALLPPPYYLAAHTGSAGAAGPLDAALRLEGFQP